MLAAGMLAANAGAMGQGEAAPALPAPPPLPENRADQIVVVETEVMATFRAAMLDPATPAQARIAAARSLAEMTGLLRVRTAAPNPTDLRQREALDPAVLATQVEATRAEIAKLEAMAAAIKAGGLVEAAPWD